MIENWRARDERKFPPTIEFWRKDAFGGHIFRIMSCCPESSWPSLGAAGYQPKGNIEKVSFEILLDKIWHCHPCERLAIWVCMLLDLDPRLLSGTTTYLVGILAEPGCFVMPSAELCAIFFSGCWQFTFRETADLVAAQGFLVLLPDWWTD